MNTGLSPNIWEKMAQLSPDLICLIDQHGNCIRVNNASESILGYKIEEILGRHYTDFVHPDYLSTTEKFLQDVISNSSASNFENCLVHKNGTSITFQWSAVFSEEDKAIFCVARNISEFDSTRTLLKESSLLYKTLFDKNPDVIFLQDANALVKQVNQSFCNVFGISKEEALDRPTTSFLSPEMVPICIQNFQETLLGNTTRYELEFETADKGRRLFDVLKFPIKLEGELVHVKTIMKDITSVVHSYETIKEQAHKLSTIFESITDGFISIDLNWKITYLNSEAERLLHLQKEKHIGKSVLDIFPDEVGGKIHAQYLRALESGESVHSTSYLKQFGRWFQAKVFPSNEGLSVYFEDVTDNIRVRQEQEKLSLVASNTTNGVIIIDKEHTIEWVNEGFTRLTGYSLKEAIGKTAVELLLRDESDYKAFEPVVQQIQKGVPLTFEVLNYKKNGEEIWFSVQISPVYDDKERLTRYIVIQTDITERVKNQKELEKLSLVASKTNNSVLIADKDWKIEWVNDGFVRLMGYSLQEAVGKKPSELLHNHKTDKKTYELLEHRLYQGESITLEVVQVRKDGKELWVNVEITALLDEAGDVTGFIEVHTDITALKESEIELAKLAKDLYTQNKDLQQFTYIVSHNLRAPVANIMGLSDVMTQISKDSVMFDKSLSGLNQSVLKLDTVLRDLNTILSIRDSKGNLEQEQVEVMSIFNQALASLQEPLQNSGGKVIVDIEEGLKVWANKAYLFSIFYNLISNSIKYRCSDRSLKIHIKCVGNTDRGTLFTFSDNGTGFDMDKAGDNVFRLYKRFHTEKNGRGIGLYLIKSHLEAMAGHVEVDSKVGVGTKFLFYLRKAST